jgi:hypothetical protein
MSVEQIQALADGLAGRLGRAVVVDDRELRLVVASADFGDADPARVWSLLNRRTRPEDVRLEEIARLTEPGYTSLAEQGHAYEVMEGVRDLGYPSDFLFTRAAQAATSERSEP